jgi:hypothetical protein
MSHAEKVSFLAPHFDMLNAFKTDSQSESRHTSLLKKRTMPNNNNNNNNNNNLSSWTIWAMSALGSGRLLNWDATRPNQMHIHSYIHTSESQVCFARDLQSLYKLQQLGASNLAGNG